MRFVILGAGAIGGVVGARLHQSGHDVVLIARGAHHDAIAANGLRFETPAESVKLRIQVAAEPAAANVRAGDVVLLCTKGQDTWPALLARARPPPPPACRSSACRTASRTSESRCGCSTTSSAGSCCVRRQHLEPGVVLGFGATISGSIDVGRYPAGSSELCERVCAAFAAVAVRVDASR